MTDRSTGFPDLDDLLGQLVGGVRERLGERLVGLYLVGSFALGAADIHSDVDFIAALTGELSDDDVRGLESLHGRLFQRSDPWAQHLEGSYVPREQLRRKAVPPQRFVYFDNGATTAIRDDHDDTHVLRWVLRERGVTLTGPSPRTLVDRVSPDELRAEMGPMLASIVAWAPEPSAVGRMSRWKQTYLVATLCRVRLTMAQGRVSSKREALEWVRDTSTSRWRPLIERAIGDRADPWRRVHEASDDAIVDETLAFVAWVADTMAGSGQPPISDGA